MNVFPSCNHPVKVNTSKGLFLASCGHCTQCLTKKAKYQTLLLDLETRYHKYVEMINLTYSDDYLPYLDFNLARYNDTDLYPSVPLHLGFRKTTRFIHGRYIDCIDHAYDKQRYFILNNKYGDYDKNLKDYNYRIAQYKERYPERSHSISLRDNIVPILYYEDVHKFTDRLQKFCRDKYGEKVRYYAVGEYGTNSLRPHWHILLFHSSFELRRDFEDVQRLHGWTELNKRECATIFVNYKIWQYGDISTSPTDGNASSYVAGYLNQHTNLPEILKLSPQKAFKSIFLGEGRSTKVLSSLLQNRDFEGLVTTRLQDSKGVEKDVSVPSSTYSRFHIGFSCSDSKDYQANFALLSQARSFFNQTDLNLYDDDSIYTLLQHLRRYNDSLHTRFPLLCNYVLQVAYPIYCQTRSLNPLKSLINAYKKLYKVSDLLDLHPLRYLSLVHDFESWLDLKRLNEFYKYLEDSNDYTLSYDYYSSFDPNTGGLDFDVYKYKPIFLHQLNLANMEYDANVKHRSIAQTYKTELYEY